MAGQTGSWCAGAGDAPGTIGQRSDTIRPMVDQTRGSRDRARYSSVGGTAGSGLRRGPTAIPPSGAQPGPVEICEPEVGEVRTPPYDAAAIERTAEVFKALAASSRLRILLVLTQGEASVTEIVDETGLSQPLVSQHLKQLRSLHLVDVDRVGREAIYSFKDAHVSHILIDALDHALEHPEDD